MMEKRMSVRQVKHELLSPAGSMDALKQAVLSGADAVYLGGHSFGARAFAANFTYDEIEQAATFAHTYGVKIYITVNTLIYQKEREEFLRHISCLCALGVDALIMQDVGMLTVVHQLWPDMDIHASTQMHNHNDAALCFIDKLGAVRAVLAREMNLRQIKKLQCPIEKEVFVHGALCIGSSGQCLLSALTQGRSGNRGQCAQSCRMRYRLMDGGGREVSSVGRYLLSPKDLALLEDIEALLDAGIGCFKIEGRMKSPEYVGQVTKIYAGLLRDAHDKRRLLTKASDIGDLKKLFNRGFTKGHLFEEKDDALMNSKRPNHAGVPLGRVSTVERDGIYLALNAPLRQGDGIKFENSDDGFFCNRIYLRGLLVSEAQAGETVLLEGKAETREGDTVVKTSDAELLARLAVYGERKVRINGDLDALTGRPLQLTLWDADGHKVDTQGEIVAEGRTRPVTADEIRQNAEKLGGTPYEFDWLDVNTDGRAFVAKSALNALRREAVQQLTAARVKVREVRTGEYLQPKLSLDVMPDHPVLHVLVRSAAQLETVSGWVTGDIYTEDEALYRTSRKEYPNLRLKTDRLAECPLPMSDVRLLVTDHGGLYVYPSLNDVTLDYSASALNADALAVYFACGARRIALSPELDIGQTKAMLDAFEKAHGMLPPVEALAYARYELMAMRHCIIRHTLGSNGCGRCRSERFSLRDDAGRRYLILTTQRCENRLFEGRAVEADVAALLSVGVRHFRVELMDEDAAQSRNIVQKYQRMLNREQNP
jgi:putative protease